MAPLPTTTAAALARRARDLLKDAAELTSGRDPNYIRDAQPDSLFEAIPLAAARQGCRRYADNPDEYSGRRQARVERACRPYLDSLNYGEPPALRLPFRGGQCPGVSYRINWTWSAPGFNPPPQTADRTGPLSITREGTGSQDCGPGGGTYNVWVLLEGTGNNPVNLASGCGASLDSISITRIDGQPDDCGSPVPELEPGDEPVTPDPPGPIRFNPRPDIDIDIDVEINPDLTFDVDFGTGPISIDPFGDEGDGGDGGGGGPPPGDVGEPGVPGMTGEGGEASGEAPEGSVLTGLRIDFVEPPIGGNEYAPGVFRGVCYIYMGTPEGLDHDPAGAMLRDGQFVYAEKDNLNRWRVSANRGYNLLVTPYYRASEAQE